MHMSNCIYVREKTSCPCTHVHVLYMYTTVMYNAMYVYMSVYMYIVCVECWRSAAVKAFCGITNVC